MDRNEILDEMLAAIAANIEYLRTNGNSQIRLKNGKFKYPVDENFVYEFQLDYLQDLDADAEIEVKVFGKSYSGKINAVRENQVEIAINQHIVKLPIY